MKIGNKLRLLRLSRGITIKDLSVSTGLSSSYISQLERDMLNPSIDSLKKICDSYDIPLSAFFDDSKFNELATDGAIIQATQRKSLTTDDSRVEMYLLSPQENSNIELLMIIAQPGGGSGNLRHTHHGEECGVVLEGTMKLEVNGLTYHLQAGDSIHFLSEKGHRWSNEGEEVMVSIWAITPPSF